MKNDNVGPLDSELIKQLYEPAQMTNQPNPEPEETPEEILRDEFSKLVNDMSIDNYYESITYVFDDKLKSENIEKCIFIVRKAVEQKDTEIADLKKDNARLFAEKQDQARTIKEYHNRKK